MIICPFCDAENIVGVEECDGCGQSFGDMYLPEPASDIERGLLVDRISSLKPSTPVTVSPDTTVGDVLKILNDRSIGCVVVNYHGLPVGIFSERDAIYRLGSDVEKHRNSPISEFMTPHVQTLDMRAKIAYAVRTMDVGHYRHIPIVDDAGVVIGIISVRDILRYITSKLPAGVA
jgi:predicted transcriptional regulator